MIQSLSILAANIDPHDDEDAIVATLDACGARSFRLQGRLATVDATVCIANGKPTRALIVSLDTLHGTQSLQLDLRSYVAQRLSRKLADAIPDEELEIVCWDNPHDCTRHSRRFWPPFSWQYATVEQGGRRLPSADASELYVKIEAAEIQLMSAGNTTEWMLIAMKDELTIEWHVELIGAIAARFAAHRVAGATPPAWTTVASHAYSSIANPFGL
jgi:hypothetical protein